MTALVTIAMTIVIGLGAALALIAINLCVAHEMRMLKRPRQPQFDERHPSDMKPERSRCGGEVGLIEHHHDWNQCP